MRLGLALIGAGLLAAVLAPFRPAPTPSAGAMTPPAKPMRVMSLNQCTDQIVLALLPTERITSVTWLSRDPDGSVMWREAGRVGVNYGQSEEVLDQHPDLVIAGDFTTPATRGLLKRLGFPLIEVPSANNFDDIRAVTRQIGAAVGEPDRAEALVAQMDATLAAIPHDDANLRVLAWNGGGYAPGKDTLFNAILTAAGARNVAAEEGLRMYREYDVEALIDLAPDAIIQAQANVSKPARRQDVARHPFTRAFYRDRSLALPSSFDNCGTPFSADGAMDLHKALRDLRERGVDGPPYQRAQS